MPRKPRTRPPSPDAAPAAPGGRGRGGRTAAPDYLAEERARLLERMLRHVPFDGWSDAALTAAAADAGCDRATVRRAYPQGVRDLIVAYSDYLDGRMIEECGKIDMAALRIRERIATAVRTRLEVGAAHRETAARALAFFALPANAPLGVRALARTVDLMWRSAGDTATDFNFYTKRALLAGVYSTTLLYWLSDKSEGHAETWGFLDRRIDDVMQIQKARSRLGDRIEGLLSALPRPPGRRLRPAGRRR